jgi:hypothetical protein
MSRPLRILVVSSCTGEKSVDTDRRLTIADFSEGAEHVAKRHHELESMLTQAESLYSGMQHQRLMRGVSVARSAKGITIDLHILSAGYGLVAADQKLAPYEATFLTMKKVEARTWAKSLGIAQDTRVLLKSQYDLGLILLGDDYLDAVALDETVSLGGPTLVFCGKAASKKLPQLKNLFPVVLSNAEARRFACALIGLKGELAARVLERIAEDPAQLDTLLAAPEKLLDTVETKVTLPKSSRGTARANPNVDYVIKLNDAWRQKPHRSKLAYFIPEWDDLVDPDFDFETDTHSGGSGDWANEVYAHQMYPAPNYDGILISKVVAEKSKKKAERINRMGVHRFLRIPRDFPVMGDCGAFGYINEEVPPYSTSEILDYYTRLDFDYGVSIDHFAIGEEADRKRRYDLTIANARDFLVEHKKRDLAWTPIGAVQGWDEDSFVKAAKQYITMGYQYIALGAMVRRRTPEILAIAEAVRKVIPAETKVHLFGVARLNAIQDFIRAGVNSADSAAALRNAWMGTGKNYLTLQGEQFSAIRIPEAEKSFRAKRMVSEGRATLDQVKRLDKACIDAMHAYDRGQTSVDVALEVLHEYDQLITPDRPDNLALLRHTLEAMPWKHCPCDICRKDGIDVIIFRGNNRNRRRGFHNSYSFYQLLQRAVAGEQIVLTQSALGKAEPQLDLFNADVEVD